MTGSQMVTFALSANLELQARQRSFTSLNGPIPGQVHRLHSLAFEKSRLNTYQPDIAGGFKIDVDKQITLVPMPSNHVSWIDTRINDVAPTAVQGQGIFKKEGAGY